MHHASRLRHSPVVFCCLAAALVMIFSRCMQNAKKPAMRAWIPRAVRIDYSVGVTQGLIREHDSPSEIVINPGDIFQIRSMHFQLKNVTPFGGLERRQLPLGSADIESRAVAMLRKNFSGSTGPCYDAADAVISEWKPIVSNEWTTAL